MVFRQTVDLSVDRSDSSAFDADVIIVGAGIVGATLACGLCDAGLRVILIEAKSKAVGLANDRAYALTLLTGEILQNLGLWEWIEPRVTAFEQIRLSDGDYPGVLQFRPADLQRQVLGYVGEHQVLLHALYDRLASVPTISWLCPAEVTDVVYGERFATVTVVPVDRSPVTLRTPLVVAADGATSPLRQAAGIHTKGWQYWQSCIGFTVRTEKSHHNIAYERFWPSGPFAILPLPGNRCQVVWTAPHAEAQRLAALSESDFVEALNHRYGPQMGQVELENAPVVFPVQLMQSDRYVLPRLVLIGDAAHCCHPVGGQGMNLGIRDAAALTEVLQAAHQQGQDWGSLTILQHYERWRKSENLLILGFTDFLDRVFSNHWFPLVILRRLGLQVLQRIYPLRYLALKLMTGQLGRKPELGKTV